MPSAGSVANYQKWFIFLHKIQRWEVSILLQIDQLLIPIILLFVVYLAMLSVSRLGSVDGGLSSYSWTGGIGRMKTGKEKPM